MKLKSLIVFVFCVSLLLFGCSGGEKKQDKSIDAEVTLSYTIEKLSDGKYKVAGNTNLADDFILTVELSNQEIYATEVLKLPPNTGGDKMTDEQLKSVMENSYKGAGKTPVKNGKFEAVFSGKNLKPGKYELSIISSGMRHQPEKFAGIYGANGEKLKGKFVRKGTLGYNMVWFEETVVLK